MKAKVIILIAILFTATAFMSFKYTEKFVNDSAPQGAAFTIPAKIKTIIDNKCYDCHNNNSKSKKGKMKLNFDKLNALKIYKLVGKLDNISEAVTDGDMPPKKAIEKYPDLKLTKDEISALSGWADNYVEKFSGE
jgi:uncharacterized membrane protein